MVAFDNVLYSEELTAPKIVSLLSCVMLKCSLKNYLGDDDDDVHQVVLFSSYPTHSEMF